jgi:hypothetical protein
MSKAIALTRTFAAIDPVDLVRSALVTGCALALIAAGNILPF